MGINVNMWAFSAICGFEGAGNPSSAAVDYWEDMNDSELEDAIDAQVENYAPEDAEGKLDARAVVLALRKIEECKGENDLHWLWKSLDC